MIEVSAGLVSSEGREGRSVLSLSPRLVDGCLLPVASRDLPSLSF